MSYSGDVDISVLDEKIVLANHQILHTFFAYTNSDNCYVSKRKNIGTRSATSRALSADAAGKLQVLWEDGHALGVDGAEIGVLKETDKECFGCLLPFSHPRRKETAQQSA